MRTSQQQFDAVSFHWPNHQVVSTHRDMLPTGSSPNDAFNYFLDSLQITPRTILGHGATSQTIFIVSATPGTNNPEHYQSIRTVILNIRFKTTFSGNSYTTDNLLLYKIYCTNTHPTADCPLLSVQGWNGVTPDTLQRK